jgi:hypothetical protein
MSFSISGMAIGLVILSAVLVGCRQPNEDSLQVVMTDDSVARFEAAVASKNWLLARKWSSQALIARPNDPELITKVATAAAFSDSKREAAELLVEAAQLSDFQPTSRVSFAVQALVEVGEIYNAIELLEACLAKRTEENSQRRVLVGFLNEVQLTACRVLV